MSDESGSARRAVMYGEDDLGSFELFSGNFINYGYWPSVPVDRPITVEERTESQAALYRTVLGGLDITGSDAVLEVGCGIGVGAALTLREFGPSTLVGLDFSREQLTRARTVNADLLAEQPARLVLEHGSALAMPFGDGTFDKCYSVEAAQHFEDLAAFAAEARRVLRPGGKLCVATFFATDESAPAELRKLIQTIDDGIDYAVPIGAFRTGLHEAGFADVRVESIGDRVWQGFDTWMSQTQYQDSWGRNWLKAYRAGLADYFLVTASVSRVTSRK